MTMLKTRDTKKPERVRPSIIRFRGVGIARAIILKLSDREIAQLSRQLAEGYNDAIKAERDKLLRELAQGVTVHVGA